MYKFFTFFLLVSFLFSCNNSSSIDASKPIESEFENNNLGANNESQESTVNDGRVECPFCNGSGSSTCKSCDGRGTQHCGNCNGDGWDGNGQRCLNCNGEGIVSCNTTETCSPCDGYGYGYLKPCSICHGSTKTDDGTDCTCINPSFLHGMFAKAVGDNGVLTDKYPGNYFNAPIPD